MTMSAYVHAFDAARRSDDRRSRLAAMCATDGAKKNREVVALLKGGSGANR